MELQQLRKFIAVAEHKNISRAARELLISQPALSRSIHELEEDVGAKLIQRGRFGIELTPEGEVLLEQARGLLVTAERIRRDMRQSSAPTVRIIWRCVERFLVDIICQYKARSPETQFEILQNDDIALENMQYDFIISGSLADESGYRKERLLTERLLCALPADHPLARKGRIIPAEFVSMPQIQFGGHRQVRSFIKAQLRQYHLDQPPRIVCDDVRTGCELVAAGFGCLLIPEYAPDDQMLQNIRLLPVAGVEIAREVYLYRRTDLHLPDQVQAFTSFLVRYFAGVEGRQDRYFK